MNKNIGRDFVIAALLVIVVICLYNLSAYRAQRDEARSALNQAEDDVRQLKEQTLNLMEGLEKEKTSQERRHRDNAYLQGYARASKQRLIKLFRRQQLLQEDLARVSEKFSLSQAENEALAQDKSMLAHENKEMKDKLGSISELKKAIIELRKQMRTTAADRRTARRNDTQSYGNRGYLVKDGKSTYSAQFRIEVIPATEK